jgi:hypothetical protein
MLELPRAQQTTQTFSRSHSAFLRSETNPSAALEWKSNRQLLESGRRHERTAFANSDKYSRPVTAAAEMGWGLEAAYKEGRVRPNEFHFGCAARLRNAARAPGRAHPAAPRLPHVAAARAACADATMRALARPRATASSADLACVCLEQDQGEPHHQIPAEHGARADERLDASAEALLLARGHHRLNSALLKLKCRPRRLVTRVMAAPQFQVITSGEVLSRHYV